MSDPAPPQPKTFGRIPDVNNRDPPKEEKPNKQYLSQSEKKGRLHSLITYASFQDIQKVFDYRKEQVRRWCAILHDKDVDENNQPVIQHYHIVAEFYDAYRVSSVRNWFKTCLDDKGQAVTTLGQLVIDRKSITDYLTHSNTPEKHQYPETDIENYLDYVGIAGTSPRNDDDSALNIIDDMLNGASFYDLIRRYGREFIINSQKYREAIALMISDGSLPENLSIEQKNEIYYKYRN